jgi:hypothetical protein
MNTGLSRRNRSGFKGVYYNGRRWVARVMYDGKRMFLGTFKTPEAAHAKYCEIAGWLYSDFFHNGMDSTWATPVMTELFI